VSLEEGIGEAVAAELDRKGHRIDWLPDWSPATAGVCCIRAGGGIIEGATDPRRAGSIVGW
jgi:gamma-glutamyltranspeptidase